MHDCMTGYNMLMLCYNKTVTVDPTHTKTFSIVGSIVCTAHTGDDVLQVVDDSNVAAIIGIVTMNINTSWRSISPSPSLSLSPSIAIRTPCPKINSYHNSYYWTSYNSFGYNMVQSLWPILFTYPYSYGPLSLYKSVSHPISGMITTFISLKTKKHWCYRALTVWF